MKVCRVGDCGFSGKRKRDINNSTARSWPEQQLELFDTNSDGKIDLGEFEKRLTPHVREKRAIHDSVAFFTKHDVNGDGFITLPEIDKDQ